jgi:hypothetical protein
LTSALDRGEWSASLPSRFSLTAYLEKHWKFLVEKPVEIQWDIISSISSTFNLQPFFPFLYAFHNFISFLSFSIKTSLSFRWHSFTYGAAIFVDENY